METISITGLTIIRTEKGVQIIDGQASFNLTEEDCRMIYFLSLGLTFKEINAKTKITYRRIDDRIFKIREFLELKNTTHLVAFALRHQLIT